MPFHGDCPTLAGSVASVRGQCFQDWELLLISDHAGSGPLAVARDLAAQDPRIHLLQSTETGAAAARNHGLAAAQGRFIACLDSDDCWHRDKLTRHLAFMAKTGAALSFTAYRRVDPLGQELARVPARAKVTYRDMLGPNLMGCLTVIYDRQVFGPQPMPDLPLQHDYALWLRLLRLGEAMGQVAHGLDEVLADYRVSRGSLSGRKRYAVRDIWRVWRQEEGLPLGACLRALARYGWHSLRHRRGWR